MASKIPGIIRRRYKKAKELSQNVFDQVEVNRNLYKGVINVDDTYEWDYSLVDPHIFPLVRNYLSRSNPTMSAIKLDVRHNKDEETRQVNQDFLNWEIGELMMTTLFYRMYFSAYLTGKGYGKTGWKYEPAIKVEDVDEDGKITRVKIMKDIMNRADMKFVRFNDLLIPNRNNPILKEQPYTIELIQQQVGDMLNENEYLEQHDQKPYWKKRFLTDLKKGGVVGKLLDYQMEIVRDSDYKEDMAFRAAYVPMMCMKTIDGEEFYMPIEGSDKVVNQSTENKYWHGHRPYIDFSPFPEDDEYYNLALVDVAGDLQIAATEILNQTMTNIRQINNDMWIAGTSAAQTPDWQFRKRPDGVIRVIGDPSQVQQVKTKDNTGVAIKMGQEITNKIERAGGISSLYSSGAANQNINQTARGAQIIDQNIDTNMKMIIDLFGEQVLKPTGEHFLELNAQYVTEDQSFSVTGKRNVRNLITIKPEQTNANFIVSVNTDKLQKQTPASRQASLQNTITVLQGIETQSQGGVQVDITPAVEALADATQELDNVDDIIISLDQKSQRDILMLERGQMPVIKIRDAHKDLVAAANLHYEDNEAKYEEEIKELFEKYVTTHLRHLQSQAEAQAMGQPVLAAPGNPAGVGSAMGFNPAQAEKQGLPENDQTYNLGKIVR